MWDPEEYSRFSRERSRPFDDLIAQAAALRPESIVDLGCGTGRLTRGMAERWPAARVVGIDSSPEMLEESRSLAIPGRLEFVRAEIAEWTPDRPIDLIVSNAALHWIGNHEALFPRLGAMLSRGGTLAVQMPDRFQTPSQSAIETAASDPRWRSLLKGVGLHRQSARPLLWYVRILYDLGFSVNAWETTYVHVLSGENPVLDWLRGTALRPLLARLDSARAVDFLDDVGARLKAAYPPMGNVTTFRTNLTEISGGPITLFPMPRLFFVATRE
jgi:trans-aconitate 2-methyltransferase